MIFPLIAARLHGFLDDLFVLAFAAGAFLLRREGAALAVAVAAAVAHLLVTRLADSRFRLLTPRGHAALELCESLAVLAAAVWLGSLFLAAVAAAELLVCILSGVDKVSAEA